MQVFRDLCLIRQDTSDAGDSESDYTGTPLVSKMPCRVIDTAGRETYKSRQLIAGVDFVVELWEYPGITPDMRVEVSEGIHAGKTLNIKHVNVIQMDGEPVKTVWSCTERTK